MAIELKRIGWEDAPSEQTPIDSGNLKQMENNTEKAINQLLKLLSTNMTLYNKDSHTYNHTGGNANFEEPIVFDYSSGNPNELLSKQNWGIKIGAGINHINVKANALIRLGQSNQSTDIYVTIRKNGEKLSEGNFFQTGFAPFTYSIYKEYLEVKEGDLIELWLAGSNADINVLDGGENLRQTQLTVEVVD